MRDADRPPRRRPRDRDDLPDPRPARMGRGPLPAILAGVGLLILVGAGVGAYFLFAGGSNKPADDKARPPRALPMDMFAYVPASDTYIRFVDVKYGRELGDDEAQLALDGVFPNAMRQPAELRYVCATGTTSKKVPGHYLLAYESPVDLAAVATELKLQPLAGNLSRVYVGQFATNEYAVFQPAPTKLFVACSLSRNKGTKPGEQVLEELLARDASASALPADLKAGVEAVSGYPVVKVHKGYKESAADSPYTEFTGSLTTSSIKAGHIITEAFTIRQFGSESEAKAYMDRPRPKPDPNAKYHYEQLDNYRWLRGDQFRTFHRTKTLLRPSGV